MKKLFIFIAMALVATSNVNAQSDLDLLKEQREVNAAYTKMLQTKPSRGAKKQAKELKKQGWLVPAGEKSIEQQIMASQIYGEMLTKDANDNTIKRYILQTAMQTAGTYNAGYAAARTSAQVELASMLKTQIAAAMQQKLDNGQGSSINANTIDKFHQRAQSIVDETLTNAIPVTIIYRELNNGNYQVQVRLAFDKKELLARMKSKALQELEEEGDKLNGILDEVINQSL